MIENMKNEMIRQKIRSDGYSDGYLDALNEVDRALKRNTYGGGQHEPERPLTELLELRQSELRPAVKFLSQDAWTLVMKVTEEYAEVMDAYEEYAKAGRSVHLAEEIADLQFACETLLAKIRPDVKERRGIRKFVICKNYNRGYYGEGEQK